MPIHHCCVEGCSSRKPAVKLFNLPANDGLREIWLRFLIPRSPSLQNLSRDVLVSKKVCKLHFEPKYLTGTGDKRKRLACPTLFSDEEIHRRQPSTPIQISFENIEEDHNYSLGLSKSIAGPGSHQHSQYEIEDMLRLKYINNDHTYALNSKNSIVIKPDESGSTIHTSPATADANSTPSTSGATYRISSSEGLDPLIKEPVASSPRTFDKPSTTDATDAISHTCAMPSSAVGYPSSSGSIKCTSTPANPITQSRPIPSARSSDWTGSNVDDFGKHLVTEQKPSSSGVTNAPNKSSRDRIVKSISNLTPKCKRIYNKCVQIIKSKRRLLYNYSEKLEKARELSEQSSFDALMQTMTPQAKTFIRMQINLANKHIKRRRFTTEEKLLALSLAKQSPKGYKLLYKMFILPSRRTLNKFTQNIRFKPGVNKNIIAQLRESVKNWDPIKKTCSVVFDEVALSPQLTFVESEDRIDGFVNYGNDSEQNLCDHALVFMVRGICSSWRQPLAYYLCEGATPSVKLKTILKDVVEAVVNTGLDPKALVCDQGSNFQACINSLRADTRRHNLLNNESLLPDNQVIVSGQVLNIVYDPPHLIKGIRNNFLTKDMLFCGKIAKWQDIIDAYKTDCDLGEIRMVRKLTDEHVIPSKIKKMKVKNATQALSEQTAGLLCFCSKFSADDSGKPVSKTMKNTSDAVLFFDKLFDSVNGSRSGATPGKMRGPVKEVNGNSKHVTFWEDAIKVLENIYYIDSMNQSISVGGLIKKSVPSLKNWVVTLKSFISIWGELKQKGVKFFYSRNLNQDPLENFFGRIRAFNYRNNNPTPYHFTCTIKSLVLNNILGPHSPGSNCEDDVGEVVLKSGLLLNTEELDSAGSVNSVSEPPPAAGAAAAAAAAAPVSHMAAPATPAPAAPTAPAVATVAAARREKINVQASAFTAGYDIFYFIYEEKKSERKRKRFAARLKSSKGIICTETPGKNVVLCNVGQATGLDKDTILNFIQDSSLGISLPKFVWEKGETHSFLVFSSTEEALLFYNKFNGKGRINGSSTPLYMNFVDHVPNNEIICQHENPDGLIILDNFITEEEEKLFLSVFDWHSPIDSGSLKNRQVKHYGYEFRYGSNDVDLTSPLEDNIPEECEALWRRLSEKGFDMDVPDQLTVNKYEPGQGIPSHVDRHSPFGSTILSLSLGSSIMMDWKHHSGKYLPVVVPARSMMIMQGEARYDWQHGIQPRTHDPVIETRLHPHPHKVITTDTVPRQTRISLTFRWTRSGPCQCGYKTLCDSAEKAKLGDEVAASLEELHVHQVYEQIAGHFSTTRHKPWPRVVQFTQQVPVGFVVLDLGAGNGKNVLQRNDVFQLAGERSSGLLTECKQHIKDIAAADCLRLDLLRPGLRDQCADVVICIAVIHHFSSKARRLQSITSISRLLRPGGLALITVWAKDQKTSNYLCKNKTQECEEVISVSGVNLPVHENRTQFKHSDLLVPWKLRRKTDDKLENKPETTLLRYYHVFEEGELENLCLEIEDLAIHDSFYEEGNWCVICKKL